MPMPKGLQGHITEAQYKGLGHDRLSAEDRELADGLLTDTFGNFEAGSLDEDDIEEILEEAKKVADGLAEPFETEGFDEAEVKAAASTIERIEETRQLEE